MRHLIAAPTGGSRPKYAIWCFACSLSLGIAFTGLGQQDNVSGQISRLQDADQRVRCDAASQLGASKDPRAVNPLVAALKDTDWRVRRDAAEALGDIGDPRAMEPLRKALNDSQDIVRRRAAEALSEIEEGTRRIRASKNTSDPVEAYARFYLSAAPFMGSATSIVSKLMEGVTPSDFSLKIDELDAELNRIDWPPDAEENIHFVTQIVQLYRAVLVSNKWGSNGMALIKAENAESNTRRVYVNEGFGMHEVGSGGTASVETTLLDAIEKTNRMLENYNLGLSRQPGAFRAKQTK